MVGDFAEEGEIGRALVAVSFGSGTIELGLALGETLGCTRGWGSGLRFTASEGERAPRGFGSDVDSGGGGGGGGSDGTCGGAGAPRGIGGGGWDRDLGSIAGARKLGGGMKGGGLGGNVGVVEVGVITGVFGGSGGTITGWGSRGCGIGSGGGGGWKSR